MLVEWFIGDDEASSSALAASRCSSDRSSTSSRRDSCRPCDTLETNALGATELGVGDVVERATAHERLGSPQQAPRFGGVVVGLAHSRASSSSNCLTSIVSVADDERVAPAVRTDLRRSDITPESRHLRLDRVRRWGPPRPQHVGQPLRRHGIRGGRDQRREELTLLRAAWRDVDAVAVTNDEWTEHFEPHR